jgi:hypothetical protein
MRINPFFMPVLVVVALFGTVFTAQAMGQWTTSGRVAIDPGNMTAADLKGWMTLQEVMDGLKISKETLYAAGKIPADIPASTALNKLEALVPGFSVTTLRSALTTPGASPAPAGTAPAATVAAASPTPPVAQPTPAATPAEKASGDGTGTGPTPVPAGTILPADQIKGKMTLRDVSVQCAVPLDALLPKLNLTSAVSDTAIKDLITQGKLTEVTDVQKVVAELQKK